MTFFKKNNELTDVSDIQSGKNAKIIWIILSTCLLLLVWGYFAELDEVTNE